MQIKLAATTLPFVGVLILVFYVNCSFTSSLSETDLMENETLLETNQKHEDMHPITEDVETVKKSNISKNKIRLSNYNNESRIVELVLVVDNGKYREMNQNTTLAHEFCVNIANVMNGLYSDLNIFVVLVDVVIWTEKDEINITSNAEDTLANFLHYRQSQLLKKIPHDYAQLITIKILDNTVVGKTINSAICSHGYSGAVLSAFTKAFEPTAISLAHLLGHSLGMKHDTSECFCYLPRCIMDPKRTDILPNLWSSCSKDSLAQTYKRGLDGCLKNLPPKMFQSPVCGNGFLEEGEECDCGILEFCRNNCCDPKTCKLKSGAKCASGECCDLKSCTLKTGTVCRESGNECDLPEYCIGNTEFCPDDTYKMDSEPCDGGYGYCYNGSCGSHSKQCKLIYGETTQVSNFKCFNFNEKGSRFGHCGYDWIHQTYTKCDSEDVLCGALKCAAPTAEPRFGLESTSILSRAFLEHNGTILTCTSIAIDFGLDTPNPGMVPNGAKCGETKMCVDQKCVSVDMLKKMECPHNCNGNGWCNNLGHCHCKFGYTFPYCDQFAGGGSIDSGSPTFVPTCEF